MSGTGVAPFTPIAAEPPVGARMPHETEAGILRLVVGTYPQGGNQLEAAVRMAAQLGFAAGTAIGSVHP